MADAAKTDEAQPLMDKPKLDTIQNDKKTLRTAPAKDDNAFPLSKGKTVSVRLGQSIMLEESNPAPLLRISILFGVFVLAAFLVWANIAEIDEVAVSSGEVVPSGAIQLIQHVDGGTVTDIRVREGDIVNQGQLLVRLDPTEIHTELDQLTTKASLLELKIDRLSALSTGGDMKITRVDVDYQALLAEQLRLLKIIRKDHDNQRRVMASKIAQQQGEIALIREQAKTMRGQLKPLQRQLKIREGLYKNKTLSLYDYLEAERQYLKEKGALDEQMMKERGALDSLREARALEQEMIGRFQKETLDELAATHAEYTQINSAIFRLNEEAARLDMHSPVQGVVQNVEVTTIGGVVKPGGTLMTVVPINRELILETRIRPEDIGHIDIGHEATVKFTTYNFSRYGSVKGKLVHISATTFEDDEGVDYYQGKIILSQNYVGNNPEWNLILPGMSATADIHTGTKTLLSYLLKPIHTTLAQAFRER